MIANGICQCGCGKPTNVITRNCPRRGYVRGEHFAYLAGHRRRKHKPSHHWRQCTNCDKTKLVVKHFYKTRSEASGYSSWCKECVRNLHAHWVLDKRSAYLAVKRRRRVAFVAQYVEYVDRQLLFERDEGICGICLNPVSKDEFEVDHIIPVSKGGEHSYDNTQIAHSLCNKKKHAQVPLNVEELNGNLC